MLELLMELDSNILLWIQEVLRNPICDPIFIFITSLGNMGALWILISCILLIFKKTRRIGMMSLLALLGSLIVNNLIIKNLVARTRPYELITGLQLLIARATDFSFPSGHTGSSFASAVILYKELPKKYGILALILATLIAFSRLYIGIHYPSDVICGALSGILIALFVRKAYGAFEKSKYGQSKEHL
ncbi:MAG: phosphatase PAP2 family protein [Lachnospiraceae bacterium]|nr:phosphatase PAP2 family protein [Lachnospiraceae bacterium]